MEMKTFILPGFSLKNKDWAEDVQRVLGIESSVVVNWTHWQTNKTETNLVEGDTPKVLQLIENNQVNIIAKSIGTAVAMNIIKKIPNQVNKSILCGIPLGDLSVEDEVYYEPLKTFPPEKVLCIQNEHDNHGSFADVERFVHAINPKIKIVSKPREDHDYPYPKDFSDFLSQ